MATWDDVRRIALGLPETMEESSREVVEWRFRNKIFVWERPLQRNEVEAMGVDAPVGGVLAVRVADVRAKKALLAAEPDVFFTTPHFDGYPAILVRLDRISVDELDDVALAAWLTRAPRRLARKYLEASARVRRG
jgi:hypothetical protein